MSCPILQYLFAMFDLVSCKGKSNLAYCRNASCSTPELHEPSKPPLSQQVNPTRIQRVAPESGLWWRASNDADVLTSSLKAVVIIYRCPPFLHPQGVLTT